MTLKTPYYSYDAPLLTQTVQAALKESSVIPDSHVHYALKANHCHEILELMSTAGLGADCVSGWEIEEALEAGFCPEDIVFAGVGKSDEEMELALEKGIGCFNVESVEELALLADISSRKGCKANVALRLNPDIKAHTIASIATGMAENKFGIAAASLPRALELLQGSRSLHFKGIHCHIGSQIQDMGDFKELCAYMNRQAAFFEGQGFHVESVNVGGGLGVDYADPERNPIPDFKAYFTSFANHLDVKAEFHCELGRSLVAQCGRLISRCLFVKEGESKRFVVLDAGMNDLLRPALYGSSHRIVNLSNPDGCGMEYDVVGPVCETTDCFARKIMLPQVRRGDLLAILSAGAYGQSMANTYNSRPLPGYKMENL